MSKTTQIYNRIFKLFRKYKLCRLYRLFRKKIKSLYKDHPKKTLLLVFFLIFLCFLLPFLYKEPSLAEFVKSTLQLSTFFAGIITLYLFFQRNQISSKQLEEFTKQVENSNTQIEISNSQMSQSLKKDLREEYQVAIKHLYAPTFGERHAGLLMVEKLMQFYKNENNITELHKLGDTLTHFIRSHAEFYAQKYEKHFSKKLASEQDKAKNEQKISDKQVFLALHKIANFEQEIGLARQLFVNFCCNEQEGIYKHMDLSHCEFYITNFVTVYKVWPSVDFTQAIFHNDADFSGAIFTKKSAFLGTIFTQNAYFEEVKFTQNAYFPWAIFTKKSFFSKARFTQDANFLKAIFEQEANFLKAIFEQESIFEQAQFKKGADFLEAILTEKTYKELHNASQQGVKSDVYALIEEQMQAYKAHLLELKERNPFLETEIKPFLDSIETKTLCLKSNYTKI